MKLGVQIADYAWESGPAGMAETLAKIARTADDAGFDVIGVADHLWQGAHLGGPEQPELECFTTLAVVAANTRHCRLVPLVAGVHFRHPALLAKTITTLDVLSAAGRCWVSAPAGTRKKRAGWALPFRHSASDLRCLRRRSRSAFACGRVIVAMSDHTWASTTVSSGRSTCRRV